MWSNLQVILAPIGALVAGGGILSIIVFGTFKLLGEKWLNSKFDERLAAYKHEQQKELEHLRFRINSLMDRTAKLHQREFDIVPEAWGRLVEAYSSVLWFTPPFQFSPDLAGMSAD